MRCTILVLMYAVTLLFAGCDPEFIELDEMDQPPRAQDTSTPDERNVNVDRSRPVNQPQHQTPQDDGTNHTEGSADLGQRDAEYEEQQVPEDDNPNQPGNDNPVVQDNHRPQNEPSPVPLRIQAIGDSHLAWNEDKSTPNQLSARLTQSGRNHYLENNAIGGATLGCGEAGVGGPDNCIPPQFVDGQWSHVLISAGGNDFLESGCGVDVNLLISADFRSGLMIDLVRQIRPSARQIAIIGYVNPLESDGEAGSCEPIFTLMRRYRDFARVTNGVVFIDARDVIKNDQRELYADDIHTSVAGSRALADYIYRRLEL